MVSDVKSRSECEMAEPVCSLLAEKLRSVSHSFVTLAIEVVDGLNPILVLIPVVTSEILRSVQQI